MEVVAEPCRQPEYLFPKSPSDRSVDPKPAISRGKIGDSLVYGGRRGRPSIQFLAAWMAGPNNFTDVDALFPILLVRFTSRPLPKHFLQSRPLNSKNKGKNDFKYHFCSVSFGTLSVAPSPLFRSSLVTQDTPGDQSETSAFSSILLPKGRLTISHPSDISVSIRDSVASITKELLSGNPGSPSRIPGTTTSHSVPA